MTTAHEETARPAPPRPQVADPTAWSFPEPDQFVLDNGLRVQAFDMPGQHVLSVQLGIPAPLAGEPEDVEGVGLIMARCLDLGTTRHTADEMAELLARKGIALHAGVGERGILVELDTISRELTGALDLLVECLTDASFPEGEVRREVRHRLADIGQDRADPASLAALRLIATYFDPADRASRPAGGSRETVARITPEDVRAHHAGTMHPDGAVLAVAGDLTGIELREVLEEAFAGWPSNPGHRPLPGDPGARAADGGRIVFVDRPGAVQTEVHVGGPGPDRSDPLGWGPYQVLSFAVGGSPHARLDAVLREERGYTYGIRAGFRPRSHGGLFTVIGSVRDEVTVEAVDALLSILDLRGSDLTDAELQHAARYQARTATARFATCEAVAGEAVSLALDGLDVDFVTRTVTQVRTLDPEVARTAWDRHRGEPWTVILVGDARHADGIRDLGRGPVEVVRQPREPNSSPMRVEEAGTPT
ncbi:insulinase family protein [Ornithinimicrobium sp. F0845]|uniref:M16 family metallopeptidase n=1 Tax=Ornithinimicrobium sp. F0845 TaxID=2926412 RepID=UPI001FF51EF7|nr:pitrilysin family protein [Ornithinimicrobium sp. F0845]MCK0111115.1 insulinase family protein [Ornithinimicrobium sp. F0845]